MVKQWLSVVKSVLASFFGVQSYSQYEKDAKTPSVLPFIIVGIIMIVVFVLLLWLLVNVLVSAN